MAYLAFKACMHQSLLATLKGLDLMIEYDLAETLICLKAMEESK